MTAFATERQQPASGQIMADSLYTLDELKSRLGLGSHAMRTARRSGLRVRYVGRRAFVLGRDVLEFVEQTGKVSKQGV